MYFWKENFLEQLFYLRMMAHLIPNLWCVESGQGYYLEFTEKSINHQLIQQLNSYYCDQISHR